MVEGALPTAADEAAIEEYMAEQQGIGVGDAITLEQDGCLTGNTFTVTAIVNIPVYCCVSLFDVRGREIGAKCKEHHIDGIANGIQPEALVMADTGQQLCNYGTGDKTNGNRPSCTNQELYQADHHTAQENAPSLWHFSAHQHIDNASGNCSNGAPKSESHHGSCGGKDAHHYHSKE